MQICIDDYSPLISLYSFSAKLIQPEDVPGSVCTSPVLQQFRSLLQIILIAGFLWLSFCCVLMIVSFCRKIIAKPGAGPAAEKNCNSRSTIRENIIIKKLIEARDAERQRIARELHDTVVQHLLASKIYAGNIIDAGHMDNLSVIKEKMVCVSEMIQESISDIRYLSYDLQIPCLNRLGFVSSIQQYCDEFSDKFNIEVDFLSSGLDEMELGEETEVNLYRIVQELFNNIRKHSAASHVSIKLVACYPNIIVRIQDDGNGFDVEKYMLSKCSGKHLGLFGIMQRIKLLKGRIEIKSCHLKGTKILIVIPYEEGLNAAEEKGFNS